MAVSVERFAQIFADHENTFQRTKTWKESNDPNCDAKLDRIKAVLGAIPRGVRVQQVRVPVGAPHQLVRGGPARHRQRRSENYRKPCSVHKFHACYAIGDDTLPGVVRARESAINTLAALRSIRAKCPDSDPV